MGGGSKLDQNPQQFEIIPRMPAIVCSKPFGFHGFVWLQCVAIFVELVVSFAVFAAAAAVVFAHDLAV